MTGAASPEVQVFSDGLWAHLKTLEEQLVGELHTLFASSLFLKPPDLLFEASFDTMGASLVVRPLEPEDPPAGWAGGEGSRPLLDVPRLYPRPLLQDPFWEEPFTERALKIVAAWVGQIWQQVGGPRLAASASLTDASGATPEQFNLNTGRWEAP